MAPKRGTPGLGLRERKKIRTRATLLDAAIGLCDRQGFESTTVDQISAIADVSPRTFTRYFATKDAIALALIDEILDHTATELARQPRDLDPYEALRRAYTAMAEASRVAPVGGLTEDRLMQILRIVVSSAALRHAAIEFRASPVDTVMAQRLGTTVDDRRVRLIATVWGAMLLTSVQEVADNMTAATSVTVDDVLAEFEATYAEFVSLNEARRQQV